MNILTDPMFQMDDGGLMSYRDLMTGKAEGKSFSRPDPLQHVGQIWLACAMTQSFFGFEGGDYQGTVLTEETYDEYVSLHEDKFHLLEGSVRFLQVRMPNGLRTPKPAWATLTLDAPGSSTKNPFMHQRTSGDGVTCPACAALKLFLATCMGAGGGTAGAGMYESGITTFILGHDALNTVWRNYQTQQVEGQPSESTTGYLFPWADPTLVALYQGPKTVAPESFRNASYLRWWMPRAYWLLPRAVTNAKCASCGRETQIDIDTVETASKTGTAYNGAMAWGKVSQVDRSGKETSVSVYVPSPYSAYGLKDGKPSKAKSSLGSPLMSVSSDLLLYGGKHKIQCPHIVREATSGVGAFDDRPQALLVLEMSTNSGAFENSQVSYLPFVSEDFEGEAVAARLLKDKADIYTEAVGNAVFYAYKGNDSKSKAPENVRELYRARVESAFLPHLQGLGREEKNTDESIEAYYKWEKEHLKKWAEYLQKEALATYWSAVQPLECSIKKWPYLAQKVNLILTAENPTPNKKPKAEKKPQDT